METHQINLSSCITYLELPPQELERLQEGDTLAIHWESFKTMPGFVEPHPYILSRNAGPVYGQGNMKFTLDTQWSKADPLKNPVNDCHEMVQDASGNILLLTNETKNNIMVFNTSGKLLQTWGHEFPGGHGLTLAG